MLQTVASRRDILSAAAGALVVSFSLSGRLDPALGQTAAAPTRDWDRDRDWRGPGFSLRFEGDDGDRWRRRRDDDCHWVVCR
jgi:hypothetical protein